MASNVVMVLGFPASGKSTLSNDYIAQGYTHLNRDTEGGKIIDLLPKMESLLKKKKKVVLDNLFPTAESRKPFIELAAQNGVQIDCVHLDTSLEDSTINALNRMWERYKKIFWSPDDLKGVQDPNMFPTAVLYKYRKEFEKPTTAEGFAKVIKNKFTRKLNPEFKNKALILDFDDTLRVVKPGSPYKYPVSPKEIEPLQAHAPLVRDYAKNGYIILGASNQSGISKGHLTDVEARMCFEHTLKALNIQMTEYLFCPHAIPPLTCYCRKPASGCAVYFINKYKLNPAETIFIGDQKTDQTWAERVGFQYFHPDEFFKSKAA